jgi:protein O-mannosyl-transferase
MGLSVFSPLHPAHFILGVSTSMPNLTKSVRNRQTAPSSETSFLLPSCAGAALIFAAIFLAYGPSINGGFILDDDKLLTEATLIKAPDGIERFWRTADAVDYWPLSNSSLWIEWRLWAMHPAGYHVTNLILHAAESILIWIILRRLSIPGAYLAAALFALHPVNVEAVAWIAQRKDMLALLFFLLSILWYLKVIQEPTGAGPVGAGRETASGPFNLSSLIPHLSSSYWLSLAAFVLAMLSKASAAILPLALLLAAWWMRPKAEARAAGQPRTQLPAFLRQNMLLTSPFFLIAGALAVVNIWFQTHGEDVVVRAASFAERLTGAGCVPWFYAYKAVLPLDLAFVYPLWHIDATNLLLWLPLLAAVALTAVFWLCRRRWSRPLLFAWATFCVSLAPAMGFADVGFMKHSLVADRYQHIAIISLAGLVAAGLGMWHARANRLLRLAAPAIAVAAVGALGLLTLRQSALYANAVTLYTDALQRNPDCWMVQNDMGKKLFEKGMADEAVRYYRAALQLKPDFPEAHYNLGLVYSQAGHPQQAIDEYQQALRRGASAYPQVFNNMGNALIQIGKPAESIEYFEKALRLQPDFNLARNGLGAALLAAGRPLDAIAQFKRILQSDAGNVSARNNLVYAYANARQYDEALATAQETIKLARSQGQTATAEELEKWVKSHLAAPQPPR